MRPLAFSSRAAVAHSGHTDRRVIEQIAEIESMVSVDLKDSKSRNTARGQDEIGLLTFVLIILLTLRREGAMDSVDSNRKGLKDEMAKNQRGLRSPDQCGSPQLSARFCWWWNVRLGLAYIPTQLARSI